MGGQQHGRQPTVVHLIVSLVRGGAEGMLVRLVPDGGLGDDGVRHVVVSLRSGGPLAGGLTARGVPLVELGMRPGPSAAAGFVRLVRLLRRERPTLLLTWLYHADLLGTLAAPLAGVDNVVWNLRGTAKLDEGMPWHTRLTVRALARLSRRPSAVAANSAAGRRDHERLGYRPRAWVALPNGYDTERWRPDDADRQAVRAELGFGERDLVVAAVGRVHHQKNHPGLLAAFARVVAEERLPQPVRLLLVGDGTEGLAIPAALTDRVTALGPRNDVDRLIRAADVSVLASAYGEGLPNVVAEAMASGIVPVATDVGDAGLLVGETGRVVAPGEPTALAEALTEVLDLPAAERHGLGEQARARIVEHYSLEAARAAYRELWRPN